MEVTSSARRRDLALAICAAGVLVAWFALEPAGLLVTVAAICIWLGWQAGLAGIAATGLLWTAILFARAPLARTVSSSWPFPRRCRGDMAAGPGLPVGEFVDALDQHSQRTRRGYSGPWLDRLSGWAPSLHQPGGSRVHRRYRRRDAQDDGERSQSTGAMDPSRRCGTEPGELGPRPEDWRASDRRAAGFALRRRLSVVSRNGCPVAGQARADHRLVWPTEDITDQGRRRKPCARASGSFGCWSIRFPP